MKIEVEIGEFVTISDRGYIVTSCQQVVCFHKDLTAEVLTISLEAAGGVGAGAEIVFYSHIEEGE